MSSGNLPSGQSVNSTTEYFNNFFNERFTTSPAINDAVVGYFQRVTGDADTGKMLASTVINTALSQGIDPMSLVDEFKKLKTGGQTRVETPVDSGLVVSTYSTYDEIVAHKNEYQVGQLFYIPTLNVFYKSYFSKISESTPLVVQTTFTNPTFNQNNIDMQRQQILFGQPQLETVYTPDPVIYVADDIPFLAADETPIESSMGNVSMPVGNAYVDTTYTTPVEFTLPEDVVDPDIYTIKTYLDQSIQIEIAAEYKATRVALGNNQYAYNYAYVTYRQESDELTPYLTVLLNSNRISTSLLGISNNPPVNKYIARAILA